MSDIIDLYEYDEEHRDTIATVDENGKRIWVYPKKPKGRFNNLRIAFSLTLLGLLFSGPFITIRGQPLLLFNFFERKFVIFGQVFWPQDFFILALILVTFFVFIILFTVVFGRLWCGWACPQTLFLEMVFRKIEYWIEGDAGQQRKLDKAPWTTDKVLKKGSKHLIYVVVSILIAHTVMAYLIGIEEVKTIVTQSPSLHLSGFLGLTVFTGIFYWVFAFFREQACVVVCPYGRLQGVLLVKDSIVVAYDWLRGEPRGKLKKNIIEEPKGDCIDCKLCVHVCPTGIDIRNGTQLECINCTACIDACDEVMVKINKPKGLIRYASYNGIKNGVSKIFNARVIGYSIVLVGLITLLSAFILTRDDVSITVLKVPGQLYQKTDDNQISNLYNIQFLNKTFEDQVITLDIEGDMSATIEQVGNTTIVVPSNEIYKGVFFIKIPKEKITSVKSVLYINVRSGGELLSTEKTKFLGPINYKK
jgi:cytochrome c oxidase accessory protein FixG